MLPESYSITLELPTELDRPVLSAFAIVDQSEFGTLFGDSGTLGLLGGLKRPLRGIIQPRDPTMGEDSGDDSASVEWCRFVAALEKSIPRDLLGSTDEGEGYDAAVSGFGETGMRLVKLAVLVLLTSRGGICRLRPRGATLGRFGVTGPDATLRSSLEARRESVNNGEGDSMDLNP